VRVGHYLIPEVFFPAMLMPVLLFAFLYAYPFLEEFICFDRKNHNILRLPSQQGVNTAIGCGVLMFLLVLFFAGGDDVIAVATGTSVGAIRDILRVLVLAAPPITAVLVYIMCAARRRRLSSVVSSQPRQNSTELTVGRQT
jgi:ubiquinol-cytochrome c reductase cytochrome b subunit